jgi:hypothetical protein
MGIGEVETGIQTGILGNTIPPFLLSPFSPTPSTAFFHTLPNADNFLLLLRNHDRVF